MRYEIITTICISVLAIITILSIIAIFIYDKNKGKQTLSTSNDITDWLFSNFQHTVFTTFYKNPKGESLCGINIEEYYRYCKIVHESSTVQPGYLGIDTGSQHIGITSVREDGTVLHKEEIGLRDSMTKRKLLELLRIPAVYLEKPGLPGFFSAKKFLSFYRKYILNLK